MARFIYIFLTFLQFEISIHKTIDNIMHLLNDNCPDGPETCPDSRIQFFLYTSDQPELDLNLSTLSHDELTKAPFVDGEIKLLLHGYTSSKEHSPAKQIKPALLERENVSVNIISADYHELVKMGCYINAVYYSGSIAMCVAEFLNNLLSTRQDIKLEQIHIISHSLGAQIAARIKQYLNTGPLERITALDPALPLFHYPILGDYYVISTGDANFIDVLHTNAGILGKLKACGDIDFYANDGTHQKGVKHIDIAKSHTRSCELYASSIMKKNKFWAISCDLLSYYEGYCLDGDSNENDWEIFGEYVNKNARGTYFFNTTDIEPYYIPPHLHRQNHFKYLSKEDIMDTD